MDSYFNINARLSASFLFLFLLTFTRLTAFVPYDERVQTPKLNLATFDIDVTPPVGHDLAYDPMIKSWDLGCGKAFFQLQCFSYLG